MIFKSNFKIKVIFDEIALLWCRARSGRELETTNDNEHKCLHYVYAYISCG